MSTHNILQWEYRVEKEKQFTEMELDNIGHEGWEMCGISTSQFFPYPSTYYFKRPKITTPTKQEP